MGKFFSKKEGAIAKVLAHVEAYNKKYAADISLQHQALELREMSEWLHKEESHETGYAGKLLAYLESEDASTTQAFSEKAYTSPGTKTLHWLTVANSRDWLSKDHRINTDATIYDITKSKVGEAITHAKVARGREELVLKVLAHFGVTEHFEKIQKSCRAQDVPIPLTWHVLKQFDLHEDIRAEIKALDEDKLREIHTNFKIEYDYNFLTNSNQSHSHSMVAVYTGKGKEPDPMLPYPGEDAYHDEDEHERAKLEADRAAYIAKVRHDKRKKRQPQTTKDDQNLEQTIALVAKDANEKTPDGELEDEAATKLKQVVEKEEHRHEEIDELDQEEQNSLKLLEQLRQERLAEASTKIQLVDQLPDHLKSYADILKDSCVETVEELACLEDQDLEDIFEEYSGVAALFREQYPKEVRRRLGLHPDSIVADIGLMISCFLLLAFMFYHFFIAKRFSPQEPERAISRDSCRSVSDMV